MAKKIIALAIVFLISGIFIEGGNVITENEASGYKGISWKDIVPVKKVAFVGCDILPTINGGASTEGQEQAHRNH